MNVHRILCLCNRHKGQNEEGYYLEFVREQEGSKKYILAKIKGLISNSARVRISIVDLENFIKDFKKGTQKK